MGFSWKKKKKIFKKLFKALEEEIHSSEPLVKSAVLANSTLFVYTKSGSTYTNSNATTQMLQQVKQALSEEDIQRIMSPSDFEAPPQSEEEKELLRKKEVAPMEEFLGTTDDFSYHGLGALYMKDINIILPPVLVEAFYDEIMIQQEAEGEEYGESVARYEAMKNFWYWLALNPNPESRRDAYTFITNNEVKLTPKGNLVLYRRIVSKYEKEQDKITAISQGYLQIKLQGKDPKQYALYQKAHEEEGYYNEEDDWVEGQLYTTYQLGRDDISVSAGRNKVGNLEALYKELGEIEENDFTDAHTHKKAIKVGDLYREEEDKIDTSNQVACSRGLHVASKSYNYSGFGDTPVMVLVNPAKIRAVPVYETGKMRVSEMFVAAVLDIDENGKYMDEDVDLVDLDEAYFTLEVDELEQRAKRNGASEATMPLSNISEYSLEAIQNRMGMMRDAIRSRIKSAN